MTEANLNELGDKVLDLHLEALTPREAFIVAASICELVSMQLELPPAVLLWRINESIESSVPR
jgi:hypothetical protein